MEKRKVILTQSSSSWFLFCVRRGKCCLGNGQEKVNRDLYANWCYFRRTTTSGFHTKWKTSLYPFKHLYNIIIKIFPPFGLSQSICVHVGIIITDMKTIFYTFKWIMYFVNYTHTRPYVGNDSDSLSFLFKRMKILWIHKFIAIKIRIIIILFAQCSFKRLIRSNYPQ